MKNQFYLKAKRKIFDFYNNNLKINEKLKIYTGPKYSNNNKYITNIICKNKNIKNAIINLFKKK